MRFNIQHSKSKFHAESGMSLLSILAAMTIFAIALLAIAPAVQQSVQREKELESIRRGEEIAFAISEYVTFYKGAKLPTSMDDLLEGLPQGTKKRQILRPSAAVDPLSADGKWRLISPTSKAFTNFGRRVQIYNNGSLNVGNNQFLNRYAVQLANVVNTDDADDVISPSEEELEETFDDTSFIGVASQSRSRAVIAYYGIENHSKWVFTPLFRDYGEKNQVGQPLDDKSQRPTVGVNPGQTTPNVKPRGNQPTKP